jgi:hypothetical protein
MNMDRVNEEVPVPIDRGTANRGRLNMVDGVTVRPNAVLFFKKKSSKIMAQQHKTARFFLE